jgi:hypothetical protein
MERETLTGKSMVTDASERPGSAALRRESPYSAMQVRAADLQPYSGLRYLAKLFRLMALVLVVLMVAETVAGLSMHGSAAVTTILSEAARLLVLAGVLWGSGDLAILLIDIGHDVRATRILIGRQAIHDGQTHTTDEHESPRVDSPASAPARAPIAD